MPSEIFRITCGSLSAALLASKTPRTPDAYEFRKNTRPSMTCIRTFVAVNSWNPSAENPRTSTIRALNGSSPNDDNAALLDLTDSADFMAASEPTALFRNATSLSAAASSLARRASRPLMKPDVASFSFSSAINNAMFSARSCLADSCTSSISETGLSGVTLEATSESERAGRNPSNEIISGLCAVMPAAATGS